MTNLYVSRLAEIPLIWAPAFAGVSGNEDYFRLVSPLAARCSSASRRASAEASATPC